jgi:hypothetical protein
MALGARLTVTERAPGFLQTAYAWMCVDSDASNHFLGVGALIAGLGLVLYLSARIQIGPVTGIFRGLPREDVRGHGRDVRGARGVRLDGKAEFWPVAGSSCIWGSAS